MGIHKLHILILDVNNKRVLSLESGELFVDIR